MFFFLRIVLLFYEQKNRNVVHFEALVKCNVYLSVPKSITESKSELNEGVDLSLCGLAPAKSQMDLFLDTLCA